jgi:chemotaxis protein histidine kinase CheA
MNIFLVAGPNTPAVQSVWQTLQHLGVQAAKPSRREGLLPQHIHDLMNQALEHPVGDTGGYEQPEPSHKILGRVWHELAADLFLGNIGHRQWGWPMVDTAQLLDYWLDFDPSTRLVLSYISPTEHLQQVLYGVAEIAPEATEQALAQWCQQVEALLARFHQASPRCLLVHATTVHGQPAQLAQAMRSQWNLHGLAPTTSPVCSSDSAPSPYQQALLAQMVSASPAAELLWQELEAIAHVASGMPPAPAATIYQHWVQQAKLAESQAALDAANQAQIENTKQLQAEAKKAQLAIAELAATQAEKARRAEAEKTDLAQENELLLQQLHQVQEELEQTFLNHQSLAAQTTQAAERNQAELAQARQEAQTALQKLQEQSNHPITHAQPPQAATEATAALQAEKAEMAQENDLLLHQLHQVQEELEHYFLKYQDVSQQHQTQLKPLQWAVDFWQRHPPEVIELSLCEDIDGRNWYHPERDGSWAGPGLVSTLQMPPVAAGRYMLELHIKDAMQPEIVLGQQISVLGQSSESAEPTELVHEFAEHGNLYPMVSMAMLDIPKQQLPWTLQISIPHNISPADSGGDDTRRLGIKLQAIRLIRQHPMADLAA